MDPFMGLVVLASSIWMAADASRLGYDKRDVRGLAAMGPVGWFFCGLLLWIVVFPLYLIKRPELKAAGEQRRRALAGGWAPGMIAGAPWTGTPGPTSGASGYGAPGYGAPTYGAPTYGAPTYGAPTHGAPTYGAPTYGAPTHGAPTYGAPTYGAPTYGAPTHGAPTYGAPPSYAGPAAPGPGPGGYGQAPPPYAPAPSPAATSTDDVYAEIIKLDRLRVAGLLTDDEFQRKKSELLART